MDTNQFFRANRVSTTRIKQIAQGLSETQLTKILPNGWSIAVTLAHLAFWDLRVIYVIELALKNGEVKPTNYDDQLNDILAPFLAEIPPARCAQMADEIADQLDGLLEACSPEMIDQLMAVNNRWVERSLHRNDHLDDIESFLKI